MIYKLDKQELLDKFFFDESGSYLEQKEMIELKKKVSQLFSEV